MEHITWIFSGIGVTAIKEFCIFAKKHITKRGKCICTRLEYFPERNVIKDLIDGKRTIALKTETFNNIFNDLCGQLFGLRDEQDSHINIGTDKISNIIYQCGFTCGRRFGLEFVNRLRAENETLLDVKEIIKRWCEFDAAAGFGKLISNIIEVRDDVMVGNITLQENFQAGQNQNPYKVCFFIKGYCAGCLAAICQTTWIPKVECEWENDGCRKKDERCIFSIK
jgi:hypothetical protein